MKRILNLNALIQFMHYYLKRWIRTLTPLRRPTRSQPEPIVTRSHEFSRAFVKSSQVKSSQVKSSQVKSSQVKSSQVKSSQVKSSQVIVRRVCFESWLVHRILCTLWDCPKWLLWLRVYITRTKTVLIISNNIKGKEISSRAKLVQAIRAYSSL